MVRVIATAYWIMGKLGSGGQERETEQFIEEILTSRQFLAALNIVCQLYLCPSTTGAAQEEGP
jgi:hypothetical protein